MTFQFLLYNVQNNQNKIDVLNCSSLGTIYVFRDGARSENLGGQVVMRHAAAQRAKITKKVHKPPRNHYIEWPVFSDIRLNCESHGEKGRTCKKYKILIGSQVFFFHFKHDLPFSPGHQLESKERFVNLFCNFSSLCDAASLYNIFDHTLLKIN